MALKAKESAEEGRRWAPRLCLAGAIVGVCALAVGLVWKSTTSPATFWSREQAEEFAAASDALHGERGAKPHTHDAEAGDPAAEAARQRFDRIQAQLERARYARDEVGPLLTKIGLAAAIAFGIGYLITHGESD